MHWRRTAGSFRGSQVVSHDGVPSEEGLDFDPEDLSGLYDEPQPSERELRRNARDRERVRAALEQFALMVSDYYPSDGGEPRRVSMKRPSERQLRQARKALERFAEHLQQQVNDDPFAAASPAPGAPAETSADPSANAEGWQEGAGDGGAGATPADPDRDASRPQGPDHHPLLVLVHWMRRNI